MRRRNKDEGKEEEEGIGEQKGRWVERGLVVGEVEEKK
jgi:hypothetical protein